MRGRKLPPLEILPVPEGAALTFDVMSQAYLEEYLLHQYRSLNSARARVEHLRRFFGGMHAEAITPDSVRNYQIHRRGLGAQAATINRETSGLSRMFQSPFAETSLNGCRSFPKDSKRIRHEAGSSNMPSIGRSGHISRRRTAMCSTSPTTPAGGEMRF